MSLYSKRGLTERLRRGKEARAKLVSSNLDKGVAFQIRATRDKRKMTQAALAAETGMTQNNVSRLEDESYGRQTLSSLKRIAEALDVALVVRLVPFSQYIDWLSGTPFLDEGIRPEAMAVPSFEDEETKERFDSTVQYFQVFVSPQIAASVKKASPISNFGFNESYSPQIVPAISGVPGASGGYTQLYGERKAS